MPRCSNRAEAFPIVNDFETQGVTLPIENEEDTVLVPVFKAPESALKEEHNDDDESLIEAHNRGLSLSEYKAFVNLATTGRDPSDKKSLRSAEDVLAKIIHDSRYDASKFVVGYLDRHNSKTFLEKGVNEWTKETTHEEFIPQHRIEYFRSTEPGTPLRGVVWARKAKYDALFKSGFSDMFPSIPSDSENTAGQSEEGTQSNDIKPAEPSNLG